jgi:hypothetical protein
MMIDAQLCSEVIVRGPKDKDRGTDSK